MTTLMRNGRDRRSGKPVKCHAILERVRLFGTRSADYIRASSHNGCIQRPNTWLHPNASLKCQIFSLHRGRRPYMALSGQSSRARVCPLLDAASTDRRNTGVKSLCWGFKLQGLAWSLVELTCHFVQIGLRVCRQVGSLRKVLSQQTIGVLVGTALPRTLRIAEVNVDVGRQRKSSMIRKLLAPVPGQRLIQLTRQHFRLLDERGDDRLRVLIGHLR